MHNYNNELVIGFNGIYYHNTYKIYDLLKCKYSVISNSYLTCFSKFMQ
ncbi:hypothetical protein SAB1689c [Staphylococcus aureus RF122]|nr:hypothetical protein SAB1689c [Staphylococcus aureus RF122]